jgi:hypothetical protein
VQQHQQHSCRHCSHRRHEDDVVDDDRAAQREREEHGSTAQHTHLEVGEHGHGAPPVTGGDAALHDNAGAHDTVVGEQTLLRRRRLQLAIQLQRDGVQVGDDVTAALCLRLTDGGKQRLQQRSEGAR